MKRGRGGRAGGDPPSSRCCVRNRAECVPQRDVDRGTPAGGGSVTLLALRAVVISPPFRRVRGLGPAVRSVPHQVLRRSPTPFPQQCMGKGVGERRSKVGHRTEHPRVIVSPEKIEVVEQNFGLRLELQECDDGVESVGTMVR